MNSCTGVGGLKWKGKGRWQFCVDRHDQIHPVPLLRVFLWLAVLDFLGPCTGFAKCFTTNIPLNSSHEENKSPRDFSLMSLNCLLLQAIFPNAWSYLSLLNTFCFWSWQSNEFPQIHSESRLSFMGRHDIYLGIKPQKKVAFQNCLWEYLCSTLNIFRKYPSFQCVCGRIKFSAKVVSSMADFTEKVKYFGWLAVCPEKERGSQYCNATWRRSKDSNINYEQLVCLEEKQFSNCTFYYLSQWRIVWKQSILTLSFHRWIAGTSFCKCWSISFLFP